MSTPQPQLLASCWTSAGDVMPARGADYSPIPIQTRIEATAAAGYVGFGLTRPDLVRARAQTTRWRSTAATAALDRVDELITLLIMSAEHVAAVADATRRLAVTAASS